MWGWHNEEIDKQIKLLLVIDRKTFLPLFFRYMLGRIVDVSSLKTTINELRKHGVTKNFIILDADSSLKTTSGGSIERGYQFVPSSNGNS